MRTLNKTPRFKKMYRKGYLFEKKTRAILHSILNDITKLKHYIIESRGSKGKAALIVGLYNSNTGARMWFGIQCKQGYVSPAQQKREIHAALKENGMVMFFATHNKQTKLVDFNPDFKQQVTTWMKQYPTS